MKKRIVRDGILEIYNTKNDVILSITENLDSGIFDIKLSGQIVTEVAHDFEDEIMACATVCKKITIDCDKLTHISSMGLNTILSLQKIFDDESDSELKLYNVNDSVFNEFKTVGFDELINIEKK